MIRQATTKAGLGYQGELFNLPPVTKTVVKPARKPAEPLDVLNFQFGDIRATARKYIVSKRTVYHVVFSDERKPLVVTLAKRFNDDEFWTSLPEGRQPEAELVGGLIDEAESK